MKLIWAHFKADVLDLLRLPAYLMPTLLFPALFFLIFGSSVATEAEAANVVTASFTAFAVLGVAFFQFGISIANDRRLPWQAYLRVLPLRAGVRFAGRVLSAMLFATASAAGVLLVAHLMTPVHLTALAWLRMLSTLLVGSIPFALFGIALGYWTPPKAAVPFANLFYLLLAYAGGLWFPPDALPSIVAHLSPFLPTRHWAELVWAAVLGIPQPMLYWLGLLAYGILFGAMAVWGYRRDEGERYR